MIGYALAGSNDLDRSRAFFDAVFGTVGIKRLYDFPSGGCAWGVGPDKPGSGIGPPFDGQREGASITRAQYHFEGWLAHAIRVYRNWMLRTVVNKISSRRLEIGSEDIATNHRRCHASPCFHCRSLGSVIGSPVGGSRTNCSRGLATFFPGAGNSCRSAPAAPH